MRVGIATDHGGFGLKEELLRKLRKAGHKVIDFGAYAMDPADDYPDFVVPLAQAVVAGKVERGVAICGSGVGASVCANKVRGIRAALVHDHFSARQGVEDDHMNILCMGGRMVASLRAIPGLVTLRPGDANEVVEAYRTIMQLRHEPAVLALSRQPLPTLDRKKYAPAAGVSKGAYVLADAPGGNPEVILIASGSEVCLAVEAHEKLVASGIRSRVVSMPSWDIFDHQPPEYRERVLPSKVKARVAIEQASTFGWERYVGESGRIIGMKTFGGSAPLKELQRRFGFEPERVVAAAKELLGK